MIILELYWIPISILFTLLHYVATTTTLMIFTFTLHIAVWFVMFENTKFNINIPSIGIILIQAILKLIGTTFINLLFVPILMFMPYLLLLWQSTLNSMTTNVKIRNVGECKIPIPAKVSRPIRRMKSIDYAIISGICVSYALLSQPQQNYYPYVLNLALHSYIANCDVKQRVFIAFIKTVILLLLSSNVDMWMLIDTLIIPQLGFIEYSYVKFIDCLLFPTQQYHMHLIFIVTFLIYVDTLYKPALLNNIKLGLLYIPLITYQIEQGTNDLTYTLFYMTLLHLLANPYITKYNVLSHIKQCTEKRTIQLLCVLIAFILCQQQWYFICLMLMYFYEGQHIIKISRYLYCYSLYMLFHIYVQYSNIIPSQWYSYKFNMLPIEMPDICLLLVTLYIVNSICKQNILKSTVLQLYTYSLPFWPCILFYYRGCNIIVLIFVNCVQIVRILLSL